MDTIKQESSYHGAPEAPMGSPCHDACPVTVNGTVCVEAVVTITPHVEAGPVRLLCGPPQIGPCRGAPSPTGKCCITIHQMLAVEVPVIFSAATEVKPGNVVCEENWLHAPHGYPPVPAAG
jgi:hypothetical protein